MHHELHHSTEYALFKDMFFKWDKWARKNKRKFDYGKGGEIAYHDENKNIDYYTINHPQKGFVNLYSTMGQEEDRCEIVSLIMNDNERPLLIEFCKKDRRLKKKVKLISRKMNQVIHSDHYF